MRCWRIHRRKFAAGSLTGEGARLFGGRWNSPGVSIIYTSTSLALAAVEYFVNIDADLLPHDLESVEIEIPAGIQVPTIDLAKLSRRWYAPSSTRTRGVGDDWIHTASSVALLAPSAAIRGDWNILLNPAHPDYARLIFKPPIAFSFDPRMFSSK